MKELHKKIPHELDRVFDFRTAGMIPPNQLLFGFNAIEQIGREASRLAQGKVMLVSDETLKKLQILDQVESILSNANFPVEVFTDIEPEPYLENAAALHEKCLSNEISMLVGVGGGSVMDITKLIAQSARRKQSPRDYLEGKVTPDGRGLPMILVPTTAGTGSEVSPYLVLRMEEKKRALFNPFYYPDIAIIDPLLTVSLPPSVTASTGIDALAHAIEGMMHKNANPFSDALCLSGMEMVGRYLRRAVADGEDLKARYYMSLAATICMMGMSMSGGLYAHSVSFVIGKQKPTPHGVGVALGLPYLMAFNLPVITAKLARMATSLGELTWMHSELEAAKQAVQAVARLMKDVGLPLTLNEYGVKESDIEEMAELMVNLYPRPMNPRRMTQEDSIKYWRHMWEGTL